MEIILAVDSFKGCLASDEIEKTLSSVFTENGYDVTAFPMSDGGDGMLEAFTSALGGHRVSVHVHDPLMRQTDAEFGITPDGTAIIETARACGLSLMSPDERNPFASTSYGVGELVFAAMRKGCRCFLIGLGGSGTSDSGEGMLRALAEKVVPGGDIYALPSSETGRCRFVLASDVRNPLCGPEGAAYVFAPQKGAGSDVLPLLDERARAFASVSAERLGYDMSMRSGAGAAGGLGYAFMQFLGAEIRSGADLLLDILDFDSKLANAGLVITGEGSADAQTLMGKLPERVLRRCRQASVPVWMIAGRVENRETLLEGGFSKVFCINPPGLPADIAVRPETAVSNLRHWAEGVIPLSGRF